MCRPRTSLQEKTNLPSWMDRLMMKALQESLTRPSLMSLQGLMSLQKTTDLEMKSRLKKTHHQSQASLLKKCPTHYQGLILRYLKPQIQTSMATHDCWQQPKREGWGHSCLLLQRAYP